MPHTLITKTIITASVGGLSTVLLVMGNGIITNDRRNTDQHTAIISSMVTRDEALSGKVEAVKDISTVIQLEQKALATNQSIMLKTLEKIEKKL